MHHIWILFNTPLMQLTVLQHIELVSLFLVAGALIFTGVIFVVYVTSSKK